jgi:hypothetical protein
MVAAVVNQAVCPIPQLPYFNPVPEAILSSVSCSRRLTEAVEKQAPLLNFIGLFCLTRAPLYIGISLSHMCTSSCQKVPRRNTQTAARQDG